MPVIYKRLLAVGKWNEWDMGVLTQRTRFPFLLWHKLPAFCTAKVHFPPATVICNTGFVNIFHVQRSLPVVVIGSVFNFGSLHAEDGFWLVKRNFSGAGPFPLAQWVSSGWGVRRRKPARGKVLFHITENFASSLIMAKYNKAQKVNMVEKKGCSGKEEEMGCVFMWTKEVWTVNYDISVNSLMCLMLTNSRGVPAARQQKCK